MESCITLHFASYSVTSTFFVSQLSAILHNSKCISLTLLWNNLIIRYVKSMSTAHWCNMHRRHYWSTIITAYNRYDSQFIFFIQTKTMIKIKMPTQAQHNKVTKTGSFRQSNQNWQLRLQLVILWPTYEVLNAILLLLLLLLTATKTNTQLKGSNLWFWKENTNSVHINKRFFLLELVILEVSKTCKNFHDNDNRPISSDKVIMDILCSSYLYSAPHPFTKLMRIVHIRVNW